MSEESVARYRVAPVRQDSRPTASERLGLRFPGAARLLREGVWRLPTSSRLRHEVFARTLRGNAEAFNRRDYDAFALAIDPALVIEAGDSE